MAASLSVLLPVHNDQSNLETRVQKLLEVLPELTSQWDLLIVDDGSTDATCEVASDLANRYPQLRLVRSGRRLGKASAVQAALEQTAGELVFVCDDEHGLDAEEIARLWQVRDAIEADELSNAQPPAPARRRSERSAAAESQPYFRISTPTGAVPRRVIGSSSLKRRGAEAARRRTDRAQAVSSQPAIRNYLDRIRQFARGE